MAGRFFWKKYWIKLAGSKKSRTFASLLKTSALV
jgi:hypothetical protein